jgi:pilus assembly protein CpaE
MRQCNVSRSRARKRSARRYAAPAAPVAAPEPAPEPASEPEREPRLERRSLRTSKSRRAADFARALAVAADVEAACAANDSTAEPPLVLSAANDAMAPIQREPLELTIPANDDEPLMLETPLDDEFVEAPVSQQETAEEFGDVLASPAGWRSTDFADEDPPFDAPDPDDEIFHFHKDAAPVPEDGGADQPFDEAAPPPPSEPVLRAVRPAPAITLHVAWDRPRCDALLEALAGDPRLKRVALTDSSGGMAGAFSRFSKQHSPDLLVLHTNLSAQGICSELDRLSGVLAANTKVVIVGQVNDVGLLRELARRNIVHYTLAPVEPDEIVRTVCELYEDNDNSRVIALVGARGGVGASTIAHNLAWTLAERLTTETAFVELDLAFGAAAFSLDHRPLQSVADGLAAPELIDEDFLDSVAIEQTERLRLLAAPGALKYDAKLDQRAIGALIRNVRRMSAYVVIDLPHQWSAWTKDILVRADEVVVVATPDLASLRNAKNLLDALKAARPAEREPLLALSMTGGDGPEISVKDFADAAGVEPVVSFGFDPALFGLCAVKGQMLFEAAPKSKAVEALDELTWVVTGRKPAKEAARKKKRAKARAAAAHDEDAPLVLYQKLELEPQPALASAAEAPPAPPVEPEAAPETPSPVMLLAEEFDIVDASEPDLSGDDLAAAFEAFGTLEPDAAAEDEAAEALAETPAEAADPFTPEAANEPLGADDLAAAHEAFGALEPAPAPQADALELVPADALTATPAAADNVVAFPGDAAPRRVRQRRLTQVANAPRRSRPGTVRVAMLLVALVLVGAWYAQRAIASSAPHVTTSATRGA